MDRHVRTLGVLNIIFGAFALVVPLLVLWQNGGFAGLFSVFNEQVYAFVAVTSSVFHIAIAIPCIICGYNIRHLKDWARTLLTLVSAINILNVPFGSMLGIYGLWVLMAQETDPLFANAPAQAVKPKAAGRARATAKKKGQAVSEAQASSTSILPSTPK
jgi:hypothetical protein